MNAKNTNIITISKNSSGQRIDNFLLKKLKGVPKSLIYKLVRSGQVRVNMKRCAASYRIAENDYIRIPPNILKDRVLSEKINFNCKDYIHYENEDLMVLNKPSGIAVHSGTNQKADFLSSLRNAMNNNDLSLVHRLDKNTSGCLLISKNYKTASLLGKKFTNKDIKKKYYALLMGKLNKNIIEIDTNIIKDSYAKKMKVDNDHGKEAYTKITVLKRYKHYTYVEVEILTGRMHQIRAHTSSIGHPIAGDNKYSSTNDKINNKSIKLNRLFLHSFYISFHLHRKYEFILDLPCELKEVLSNLEDFDE